MPMSVCPFSATRSVSLMFFCEQPPAILLYLFSLLLWSGLLSFPEITVQARSKGPREGRIFLITAKFLQRMEINMENSDTL